MKESLNGAIRSTFSVSIPHWEGDKGGRGGRGGEDIAYPFRSSDSRPYRYLGTASRVKWEALLKLLSLSERADFIGRNPFIRSSDYSTHVLLLVGRLLMGPPPLPPLERTRCLSARRLSTIIFSRIEGASSGASDQRVTFDVNDYSSNLIYQYFSVNNICRCVLSKIQSESEKLKIELFFKTGSIFAL